VNACVPFIEHVDEQFFYWTTWSKKLFSVNVLGRWLLLMRHQDEKWFGKHREDGVRGTTITMAMLHNEATEKKR
jgi:hypothetical protein